MFDLSFFRWLWGGGWGRKGDGVGIKWPQQSLSFHKGGLQTLWSFATIKNKQSEADTWKNLGGSPRIHGSDKYIWTSSLEKSYKHLQKFFKSFHG